MSESMSGLIIVSIVFGIPVIESVMQYSMYCFL